MNDDFVFIRQEPVARKYELSFHENDCSFEIRTRKEYLHFFNDHQNTQGHITKRQTELGLGKWHFGSSTHFGYSDCFTLTEIDKEWISLKALLTEKTGIPISVTFTELFPILESIAESKRPHPSEPEQEMLLRTAYSHIYQIYGAVMSADLSNKFTLWLYHQDKALCDRVNPKVNSAMLKVFKKLFKKQKAHGNGGGLENHAFLLYPPVGVYTCQFGIDMGQSQRDFEGLERIGYETFCHNLDMWRQQLLLLAGFAVICEEFRNDQKI